MSKVAALALVAAAWLAASPAASAHGDGSILAKRDSLVHAIAGDERCVGRYDPR